MLKQRSRNHNSYLNPQEGSVVTCARIMHLRGSGRFGSTASPETSAVVFEPALARVATDATFLFLSGALKLLLRSMRHA